MELYPEFENTHSRTGLECIVNWLDGTEISDPTGAFSNAFRTTLTTIEHITLYSRYLDTSGVPQAHRRILDRARAAGIQGFCNGLISSVAVACSTTEDDLGHNAAWAIRIAFLVGVIVDTDLNCGNTEDGFRTFVAQGKLSDFYDVVQSSIQSHPGVR